MSSDKHNAIRGALLGGVLVAASAAFAHHSTAVYDGNKLTTVSGTVTEVRWVNPHTSFDVLVTGSNGKATKWAILSGTPTLNVRNGWKYTDVKKGDKVTAAVHPARDGSPAGILAHITLADGRTIQGPREFLSVPKEPGASTQ